jgi:hypothetical protein
MVRELSSQPGIRPAWLLLCRLRGIADGGMLLTATEPVVIDKPPSTLFHCPNGIEKIAFEAFGFPAIATLHDENLRGADGLLVGAEGHVGTLSLLTRATGRRGTQLADVATSLRHSLLGSP